MKRAALITECGKHRLILTRKWEDSGKKICFIGLNPSTADENLDDATVRKWIGFSTRLGAGSIIVANVFTYRVTDSKELSKQAVPQHETWLTQIEACCSQADIIIPCWGNKAKVDRTLQLAFRVVDESLRNIEGKKPILCFGKTKSDDPKHPLMLGYDTKLVNYF